VNIKPQSEHLHKGRFIPEAKRKAVESQNKARWERQGKTVIKLHESYADNSLPETADLKLWAQDFHKESGKAPNILLWPYRTKARYLILYIPEICPGTVTLKIKQSEFCQLEYHADGN
jgi:hypothetical protein